MKRRGVFWTVIALGALMIAGVAAWRLLGPVAVETAQPTRGPAVQAVYATGTVEPIIMLPIAPRSAGRLLELKADEGEQNGDNPEADHHLALGPAHLFKMVMDGRHEENAAARPLEPEHLDHHA